MTVNCACRFVLEVRTFDGDVLHREALSPDWEPAVEATRLAGLRARGVWHQAEGPEPRLEPLWHEAVGEPVLQGLRVHMEHGGHAWFADFPTAHYFREVARSVVAARLADGKIKLEDRVRYAVAAYAAGPDKGGAPGLRFDTAVRPQSFGVRERSFGELVARSQPCGDANPSDIDVVLPEEVLDEICTLARDAGECETGGILLGHICRDEARADIGLEVTAHVAARHTMGDAVKLTFTSDTWTDMRAAVALRRAGELLVGWWHSHPARGWCKECPIERQKVCRLNSGFLSADDRALQRAMFPEAYTQALVVTNSVRGLETRLFGWRNGVLQPRGFWLRRGAGASALAWDSVRDAPSAAGGGCADEQEPLSPDTLTVPGL